jgi:hypothetical protein
VTRKRRLGVVGTFVWDVIHGRDRRQAPIQEWGGITYSLSAIDAALSDEWEIVPICKVGDDLAAKAREFTRGLRHIAPGADPIAVPYPNNRVELIYHDAERRSEVLSGGIPGWTWVGLAPLLTDIDALYVNMLSGNELDIETAKLLRQHYRGPIYCDLHSVVLGIEPNGLRIFQPLPNATEWARCFDLIQMNEDELAMMAPDGMTLAARALADGVQSMVVTLGSRGLVYFAAPSFERLSDIPRLSGTTPSRSGAVRTALVPAALTRTSGDGDPTGCGDVWGGTYYSRLLSGDSFLDALQRANDAAARNVEHRGATGLAHHLRGELSPT